MELAKEITSLYHSKEEAKKAEERFKTAFQKKVAPDDIPILKVDSTQPSVGLAIVDALMSSGKYPSKSEIWRLMKQGAIRINGKKVTDIELIPEIKADATIQVGKGTFYKLKVQDKGKIDSLRNMGNELGR